MNEEPLVEAIEESKKPQDNTVVLSTGVVLRCKQANPLLLMNVMAAYPRPKPPVWHNPTMGRQMENPDDPAYIEAVANWKLESSNATLKALILLGTEVVKVPKGIPKAEDNQWLEIISLLNIPMNPDNKSWRYLNWVMSVATNGVEDLNKISEVVGRLSGVPEKNVKAAEEFPGSDQTDR